MIVISSLNISTLALAAPPLMDHYIKYSHLYQSYELQDCFNKDISQSHRDKIRGQVLLEFKKHNEDLIRIDIQDRQCAFNDKQQPLGSAILVYSTVYSLDEAYKKYGKVSKLLFSEQFGVFLYDASLKKFIKTLKIFPSKRWRDYMASIEFDKKNNLSIISQGSTYGDIYQETEIKEPFTLDNKLMRLPEN